MIGVQKVDVGDPMPETDQMVTPRTAVKTREMLRNTHAVLRRRCINDWQQVVRRSSTSTPRSRNSEVPWRVRWHRAAPAAVIVAAQLAAFGLCSAAEDPLAFVRSHSLSLERLGYTADALQSKPPSALSAPLSYAEYALVNRTVIELLVNVLSTCGAALAMSRGPLGGAFFSAPLAVSYLASLGAAIAGVDASLAAVEGWLRIRHGDSGFDELVTAGGRPLLVAAAVEESPDVALIARLPTHGGLPAVAGMVTFALLDHARSRPLFAAALFPFVASIIYAGAIPAPDVPFPLTIVNGLWGTTTAHMNAVGAGVGAVSFITAAMGRRLMLRAGPRPTAAAAAK